MYQSMGILEVVGMAAATACTDRMIKSAFVQIDKMEKTGSGLLTIIIRGDLASVQYAIEKGVEEAMKFNALYQYEVIPRPYEGIESVFAIGGKGDK